MTSYEKPDFALSRLELLDWAQRENEHIARMLSKAGDCRHCVNFESGHCKRWGMPVPEDHQATGCDDWCIDLIPF